MKRLSSMQLRLWFVDQLQPGDITYNIPVVLRVKGRLDPRRLQSAVDAVVARHEAMRTRFLLADGEPRQEVVPDARVVVDTVDRRGHEGAQAATRAYTATEARRPFDFTLAPLMRCVVIRLGDDDDDQLVAFTVHRIVFDGLSAEVFFGDLAAALSGDPLSEQATAFRRLVVYPRGG